ncbi:MAG TPA: tRNA (adenosine(37)-N6)-threonylcarbamoyltransferase complex ATPase subunit type 1 TsaE, partial [Phycisphaerae bacterium]|nr:tRNA (adenosine(37)-N6)-threonylcarbamoyltransferase complex ATPase subunit type 1 TsaE [Phycisphaerae bacterium]
MDKVQAISKAEFHSHNIEETLNLGRSIGRMAEPGQCIALDGPLGVGKTQLVRGIAVGAKAADPSIVNSPTYVLLNVYEPAQDEEAKTVFHLDAYRVRDSAQFAAIGFDELLEQGGVVVLEWASRVPDLLPEDHLQITGEIIDENNRLWS